MGYVDTKAPPAPAHQQPDWLDAAEALRIRQLLAGRAPLVSREDVTALRAQLARVAAGEALVMQAGDCAEDPADCDDERVLSKAAAIDRCAATLADVGDGRPVLRIGRIAGQFAKPRSRPLRTDRRP